MAIWNKNIHTADPKLRKMVLILDTGISGTRDHRAYLVPPNVTQEELDAFAWDQAVEHASLYGVYNIGDYMDMSEEELEEDGIDLEDGCYTDDISGYWEEYNEVEHEGHLVFGSNSDFQWLEF